MLHKLPSHDENFVMETEGIARISARLPHFAHFKGQDCRVETECDLKGRMSLTVSLECPNSLTHN